MGSKRSPLLASSSSSSFKARGEGFEARSRFAERWRIRFLILATPFRMERIHNRYSTLRNELSRRGPGNAVRCAGGACE